MRSESVFLIASSWTGTLLPPTLSQATFLLFLMSAQATRLQGDLGFGTAQNGYAIAGYFLFAAFGSMTRGVPIDRLGATRVVRRCSSAGPSAPGGRRRMQLARNG